ncbi:hypothetical protein [Dasania marina]|uniref:hypothetical protein n=1 Tax=Dasania marina TaxID=471499 RepID=UPI0012E9C835|nr:hypothetical protein [Dasania marina]
MSSFKVGVLLVVSHIQQERGVLYFQHQDRVDPIFDVDQPIEFENIKHSDSNPLHELVKQVYEFQNYIYEKNEFRAEDKKLLSSHMERKNTLVRWNKRVISHYSAMSNV